MSSSENTFSTRSIDNGKQYHAECPNSVDNQDRRIKEIWESLQHIILESPSTRPMDITPAKFARDILELSPHTVKKRVDAANLSFPVCRFSNYTLYPYECLPILKAYMQKDLWKCGCFTDTRAFFEQLAKEIKTPGTSSFCINYLYTDPDFEQFLLCSNLLETLDSRMDIIKALTNTLAQAINSHNQLTNPNRNIFNAITKLDDIIIELVNYLGWIDESSASVDSTHSEKGKTHIPTPSDYVKKWCEDLKAERARIIKNEREITLQFPKNIPSNDWIDKKKHNRIKEYALDVQLYENLSDRQKSLAAYFSALLFESTLIYQETNLISTYKPDKVRFYTHGLINYLADKYLIAVRYGRPIPIFDEIEAPSQLPLPKVLLYKTKELYRDITDALIKIQHIIELSYQFLVFSDYSSYEHTTKLFRSIYGRFAAATIYEIFSEMKNTVFPLQLLNPDISFKPHKSQNITKDSSPSDLSYLRTMFDCLQYMPLRLADSKKRLCSLYESFLQHSADRPLTPYEAYALGSITVESFWRFAAAVYSEQFAGMFSQYQAYMKKNFHTPVSHDLQ